MRIAFNNIVIIYYIIYCYKTLNCKLELYIQTKIEINKDYADLLY